MERIKGVFVAGLQERFGKQVPVLSNLVGLISDTHGLIRPEALDALRDSGLIISLRRHRKFTGVGHAPTHCARPSGARQ
jgi:hypothetical protein